MMKIGLKNNLPRAAVWVSGSEAGAFKILLPKTSAPTSGSDLGSWEQHVVSKSLCSFCDS